MSAVPSLSLIIIYYSMYKATAVEIISKEHSLLRHNEDSIYLPASNVNSETAVAPRFLSRKLDRVLQAISLIFSTAVASFHWSGRPLVLLFSPNLNIDQAFIKSS